MSGIDSKMNEYDTMALFLYPWIFVLKNRGIDML